MSSKHLLKIFIVLCTFLSSGLFAQEVRVEAVLDSSRLRIGEQVKMDIYVNYEARYKDLKIQWPSIGDTLSSKVEVISVSPIDTTFPDKTNSTRIFQHQQVTVSVYDSGFYAIPPLRFVVNNDSANSVFTEPLFLQVHTVPTDTSAKKLKDIKTVFDEPFSWKWYQSHIYWGLAILVALIIGIILLRRYLKNKNAVVIEPEKPRIPPHITALAELERVKTEQIWKEGKVKEYYSAISDTVRMYIEERFNVNALESTTDEIMLAFRAQVVDKESKEKLQQMLMLSDLVKFAKLTPVEAEHTITLQHAFDFINGTKREEVMTIQPETDNNTKPEVQ